MAVETYLLNAIIASIITAASFTAALFVLIYIRRWITRVAKRTKTKLDDYAATLFKGPITVFVLVLAAVFDIRYWDGSFPGVLPAWLSASLDGIVVAIGVIVATSIVVLIFNAVLGSYVKKVIAESPETETTYKLIIRIMAVVAYLVGGLVAITIVYPGALGSLTGLLFGAGFLAIVLGLAAQKVIGNLLSGINVGLTRPIKMGDAVVVRGEFGFVEDLGLRHAVIRTWDNRRMMIPNSVLDDEIIINYTAKDPKKLFGITVGVPYDTDIEKVADVMTGEAKKHPNVLPELEPIFQVLDFGEGAITLRLLFMARDQPTAFGTGCALRRSIKKKFDNEGIRISCPTRYVVTPERSSIPVDS